MAILSAKLGNIANACQRRPGEKCPYPMTRARNGIETFAGRLAKPGEV
ncbi:MAG: hypothetical protein OEZ03_12060 [Alphaproteobacteria bacterium]|nr:hypothetical protein [Alphaproteobacteria bacterium]